MVCSTDLADVTLVSDDTYVDKEDSDDNGDKEYEEDEEGDDGGR